MTETIFSDRESVDVRTVRAVGNFHTQADPEALPVLALDLATKCGFAHRTARCIHSGTVNFAERRGETRGDRLRRFQKWLSEFHAATPLTLIAYELVQFMGTNQRLAAHCYAQFEGVLLAWAARREVPVITIHAMTLKKAVAGTGRADKQKMIDAVQALGFAPDDDNEADALAVLHWATNLRGKA